MAAVYLAHDRELERPVAVKVLADTLALDDEFAHRFRREAQTAARLSHPNIVQVFDTGEEDGRLFIVMEYVEGDGLDAVLAREGRLPPDRVLALAGQACTALQYAHEHGVIHRDVKPANFLLRRDGLLKVADFGIARPAQSTQLTQVGKVLGTLNYLSPEQARGEDVGPQSDVYSLGIVLYELLTGRTPRRFDNIAQLATAADQPVTPVRDLVPDVPPEAEAAVMRCLARNPAYRPASAAELAAELQGRTPAAAATVAVEPATVPLESPTRLLERDEAGAFRRHRRAFPVRQALAVLAVALVAAVGIAVALASGGGEDERRPAPVTVEGVPSAEDPLEQARNLEDWLRRHTAGTNEP